MTSTNTATTSGRTARLAGRSWLHRSIAVAALGSMLAATVATASHSDAVDDADPPVDIASSGTITLSMAVEPGDPVPVALVTEQAAASLYDRGYDGQGVDVALIDSGVAPVPGLDQQGKLLHGPDLSNEGGQENLANLDTYGHGTHIAGIIAGDDGDQVAGVAPSSRIVSVKVAGATGETDIAQVIAGIDWVVEHKNDNGLNIRVLNLSLGVGGVKTNEGDPLSAAVERAWDAGIVVVAAAGNRGNDAPGIDSPALSPYVVAVGGTESFESSGAEDVVAGWSSGGNGYRTPDVVAPGRSILSLRVPGSMLDQLHPEAAVGDRYFRGSGTSQSAAVVSGYAALLLSSDPSLTPDQVKFVLSQHADDIASGTRLDGHGRVDLAQSFSGLRIKRYAPTQQHPRALLQSNCLGFETTPVLTTDVYSRDLYERYLQTEIDDTDAFVLGDVDDDVIGEPDDVLTNDVVLLEDLADEALLDDFDFGDFEFDDFEFDDFDDAEMFEYTLEKSLTPTPIMPIDSFDSAAPCDAWSGGSWNGATWSGGVWNGATWSGATWSGATWSGGVWNGATWSGATWSGATWSGATWSGATWSGATWSGATWSGATWSSTGPFGTAGR